MDLIRINQEFMLAQRHFHGLELWQNPNGTPYVRAVLGTSVGTTYIMSIRFPEKFPYEMPSAWIDRPALTGYVPHRYQAGNICYLHPSFWNPGVHDLRFVLAHAAKWLNKYDVCKATGKWPGVSINH